MKNVNVASKQYSLQETHACVITMQEVNKPKIQFLVRNGWKVNYIEKESGFGDLQDNSSLLLAKSLLAESYDISDSDCAWKGSAELTRFRASFHQPSVNSILNSSPI